MQVEFYPHHGYLNLSLTIWLGIYLFFIIERCLKIVMDAKARRRGELLGGHGHAHNHSHHKNQETLVNSVRRYLQLLARLLATEQASDPDNLRCRSEFLCSY